MDPMNKKIFLSYRRELSKYEARSVYQHLRGEDYDVFMDVESIDSGEFATIILNQIAARPHFLVILTPGALARTKDRNDWLRREIEYALEQKRNIVPVMMSACSFEDEEKRHPKKELPGKIKELKKYNWLNVPDDYFEAAMKKLTGRFLKQPADVSLFKPPEDELKTVFGMIQNADRAKIDSRNNQWVFPPFESFFRREKDPSKQPAPKEDPLKWLGTFGENVSEEPSEKTPPTKPVPDETTAEGLKKLIWGTSLSELSSGKVPLTAPVLKKKPGLPGLQWNEIPGATGYVLEKSPDRSFPTADEVYHGEKTSYYLRPILGTLAFNRSLRPTSDIIDYYRVKAKGGSKGIDSPWSNIVEIKPSGEP